MNYAIAKKIKLLYDLEHNKLSASKEKCDVKSIEFSISQAIIGALTQEYAEESPKHYNKIINMK